MFNWQSSPNWLCSNTLSLKCPVTTLNLQIYIFGTSFSFSNPPVVSPLTFAWQTPSLVAGLSSPRHGSATRRACLTAAGANDITALRCPVKGHGWYAFHCSPFRGSLAKHILSHTILPVYCTEKHWKTLDRLSKYSYRKSDVKWLNK